MLIVSEHLNLLFGGGGVEKADNNHLHIFPSIGISALCRSCSNQASLSFDSCYCSVFSSFFFSLKSDT